MTDNINQKLPNINKKYYHINIFLFILTSAITVLGITGIIPPSRLFNNVSLNALAILILFNGLYFIIYNKHFPLIVYNIEIKRKQALFLGIFFIIGGLYLLIFPILKF